MIVGLSTLYMAHTPTASAAPTATPTITDAPLGPVHDVAVGEDGTTYVVGNFNYVGAPTGGLAKLDATSGALDRHFPPVDGPPHPAYWDVSVVEPDGEGGYFVGGSFTLIGGMPATGLARVLADGSVDRNWTPTLLGSVAVSAIAVSGGRVYVGGYFQGIEDEDDDGVGPHCRNLVAFDEETGSHIDTFCPNPGSLVYRMTANSDSLYVVQSAVSDPACDDYQYSPCDRIGAYDSASGDQLPWAAYADNWVATLQVSSGRLFVGGWFSGINGHTRTALAALESAPSTLVPGPTTPAGVDAWDPLQHNVTPGPYVSALDVDADGVYVAGRFRLGADPSPPIRVNAAAFTRDESASLLPWNPEPQGVVNAMEIVDGSIFLGGTITSVGGIPDGDQVAKVRADTGAIQSWEAGLHPPTDIFDFAPADDGESIIVAGAFSHANVAERTHAAAIANSGGVTAWDPQLNGAGDAIALHDSQAFIGGDFSQVNGSVTRTGAASFSTDDTGTATLWDPNVGDRVRGIAVDDDVAYLVGDFVFTQGTPSTERSLVAAFTTDGAGVLVPWSPRLTGSFGGPGPRPSAKAIVISNDVAYIGGDFTTVQNDEAPPSSASRPGAAAFALGDVAELLDWSPWTNGEVTDISIFDGKALLAGAFTELKTSSSPPAPRTAFALVTLTGEGEILSWDPKVGCRPNPFGSDPLACPRAIGTAAAVNNGIAYLGGDFQTVAIPGTPTPSTEAVDGVIAVRLDESATWISDWNPDVSSMHRPEIHTLELAPSGLIIAGNYLGITLSGAAYPARLSTLPVVPTVPAAPTTVAAVPEDAAATISWTVTSTGGSPITRIDIALDDTVSAFYTANASVSSVRIAGLTNGTNYRVYVRVANAIGSSEWSSPGVSVTPMALTPGGGGSSGGGVTPPSPPGSPTKLEGVPGNAQVALSWMAPFFTGSSPITTYRVLTGAGEEVCTTAETSCRVTGLLNGTAYRFTVTARNSVGWGAPSASSTAVTPRTTPTSPQIAGVRAGDGQAFISWRAPQDDGGSPISGYQVVTVPKSQGCHTVTDLRCTISGLRNGTRYVVSVTAINEAGASLPSPQVSVSPQGQQSITITGKRDRPTGSAVSVRGLVKGTDVDRIRIYLRTSRSADFRLARTMPRVASDGTFTWTVRSGQGLVIYAVGGGVRSNRVVIEPL